MGSLKCAWCHTAVYIMTNICLTGCTNNETNAPISSVNDGSNISSSVAVESIPKSGESRTMAVITARKDTQRKINISQKGNIIYNRSYDNILRGSYSGKIYQVKYGDTLFYIAWITGSDYRDLAKKNSIPKPYSLNVGQILQVNPTIDNNMLVTTETTMASNTKQTNTDIVVESVSDSPTQLRESSIASNKNNSYRENYNKQSKRKILQSSNGKILSAATTIISDNTTITDWCWPTNGEIIDNFSVSEGGNKGIDISGFRGQLILATSSGRVVYAGNALQGYGNLIIIKHNDDYLSAYAHNSKILVRERQEVKTGQKIATMGSTGTSTNRLHFEIRYKGKSVNPLHYLPKR